MSDKVLFIYTPPRDGFDINRLVDEYRMRSAAKKFGLKAYRQSLTSMLADQPKWSAIQHDLADRLMRAMRPKHYESVWFYGSGSCELARLLIDLAYHNGLSVRSFAPSTSVIDRIIAARDHFLQEQPLELTTYGSLRTGDPHIYGD